jgi:hypothetical protein
MDRPLTTLHDEEAFRIYYDQWGPLKVFHYELKVQWTPAVGRRFKRAVQRVFDGLGEPAFVAFFHNGQHGQFQDKLYRWLGFYPYAPGEYDGAPCTFYLKVR